MHTRVLFGADARALDIQTLDQMYRLRHTVFSERLGWTARDPQGREVDFYDCLDPVYLIARDEADQKTGQVAGCWRLLPTTGPYMLKDIFSHLLWGASAPEREDVWEISRFAVNPDLRGADSLGSVCSVVGRMLIEMFDFAEAVGITRIVAASDIRFDRILQRAGLKTTHFGPAVAMDKSRAVAGWADITQENREIIEGRMLDTVDVLATAGASSLPCITTSRRQIHVE